ncbi:hypothetical protein POMI540_4744 [Schizosaccharomyces pombe]
MRLHGALLLILGNLAFHTLVRGEVDVNSSSLTTENENPTYEELGWSPEGTRKLTLKCSWFTAKKSKFKSYAEFFVHTFDDGEVALSFFKANEWQDVIGWNEQVEEMINFAKARDTVVEKSFSMESFSQDQAVGPFVYLGDSKSVWTGDNSITKLVLVNETGSYCIAARPMSTDGPEFALGEMRYLDWYNDSEVYHHQVSIFDYISLLQMGGVFAFFIYWIWACLHYGGIILPSQKIICLYIFLFALNENLWHMFSLPLTFSLYEIKNNAQTNVFRLFVIYSALGFGITRPVPRHLLSKGIGAIILLCAINLICLRKGMHVVLYIFDSVQYKASCAIWVYSIYHLLKQCSSVSTHENSLKTSIFRRFLKLFIFLCCVSPVLPNLLDPVFIKFDYRIERIVIDLFTFMEKIAFPCYIMSPKQNNAIAYNSNASEEAQEKTILQIP